MDRIKHKAEERVNEMRILKHCTGTVIKLVGEKTILELAKNKICPHYILKHPITRAKTIYFINSELNNWLIKNYVSYNEGHFTPEFNFIFFDKKKLEAKENIPAELAAINNLFTIPIKFASVPPCIYFLCLDGKIQYIGKSMDLSSRIKQHLLDPTKIFSDIFFITCPESDLDRLESKLIRQYSPPLNITYNKPKTAKKSGK